MERGKSHNRDVDPGACEIFLAMRGRSHNRRGEIDRVVDFPRIALKISRSHAIRARLCVIPRPLAGWSSRPRAARLHGLVGTSCAELVKAEPLGGKAGPLRCAAVCRA